MLQMVFTYQHGLQLSGVKYMLQTFDDSFMSDQSNEKNLARYI